MLMVLGNFSEFVWYKSDDSLLKKNKQNKTKKKTKKTNKQKKQKKKQQQKTTTTTTKNKQTNKQNKIKKQQQKTKKQKKNKQTVGFVASLQLTEIAWTVTSEHVPSGVSAQRRFRSDCACAVWSESSLGAFWTAKGANFLLTDNEGCAGWSDLMLCAYVRMYVF